jgi:hypothetical protein
MYPKIISIFQKKDYGMHTSKKDRKDQGIRLLILCGSPGNTYIKESTKFR